MNAPDHLAASPQQPPGSASYTIPLGVTRGLTSALYHSDRSAVSSSQLKAALVSGKAFSCALADAGADASSDALLFGTVLHAFVLEHDTFHSTFYAMPPVKLSTKGGRARAAALLNDAGNRTVFPETWLPSMEAIAKNIRAHKTARELIRAAEKEVAIAWVDPNTGVKCKAKADLWCAAPALLADLKTCRDVSARGFERQCTEYQYPLSAAMYREGFLRVTGERHAWLFIAVEKQPPYDVAVYRPSEDFLRRGEREFRRALANVATWRAAGEFPGLQPGGEPEVIGLPGWY